MKNKIDTILNSLDSDEHCSEECFRTSLTTGIRRLLEASPVVTLIFLSKNVEKAFLQILGRLGHYIDLSIDSDYHYRLDIMTAALFLVIMKTDIKVATLISPSILKTNLYWTKAIVLSYLLNQKVAA